MLTQFSEHGFDVFAGSESFLLRTLRHGGAGCISATANVNPNAIYELFRTWRGQTADAQQESLDRIRQVFQRYPMIPALKEAVAHWSGNSEWRRLRPPLVQLSDQQCAELVGQLESLQFSMPNRREG